MRSLPNVHGKWQIKETGQQKKYPFDNNLWLEESSCRYYGTVKDESFTV